LRKNNLRKITVKPILNRIINLKRIQMMKILKKMKMRTTLRILAQMMRNMNQEISLNT